MRLGAPVTPQFYNNPETWIAALRERGYSAAYCPVGEDADPSEIAEYRAAAREADIVIAEVGIWRNMIHPDKSVKREHITYAKRRLRLADAIGANCTVNYVGSKSPDGKGPDPENFSSATLDEGIAVIRKIIDEVEPQNTFFTLELMPTCVPDSVESYLETIAAVDRRQFAVHIDPVNILGSHRAYARRHDIVRECFAKLGPYAKSCHVKDVITHNQYMTHIDECPPGEGTLDHGVFLEEAEALNPDLPLMLEHMKTDEQYREKADYLRSVAKARGIAVK